MEEARVAEVIERLILLICGKILAVVVIFSDSPSDAIMTNLILININAKSSDCTYRSQVVLELILVLNPADV